jgi:hypothetical protein
MATGRTVNKHTRVYVGKYDLSSYVKSIGPLSNIFSEGVDDPINASVVGTWIGQGNANVGTINGIFDNTAAVGIHTALNSTPANRYVTVAMGIQGDPAIGDPSFSGTFRHQSYIATPEETPSLVSLGFSGFGNASSAEYPTSWGRLLHVATASTTDNTDAGIDWGNHTHLGAAMVWHCYAGAGTDTISAHIKVQHCATAGGVYTDLLDSLSQDMGVGGVFSGNNGGKITARNVEVYQYTRWQVEFETATSLTFILSLIRAYV